MNLKKNRKVKFFYKQLIGLKQNIENNKKILKFKAKKWNQFIKMYKTKLKWNRKKSLIDQEQLLVFKYPNSIFSYKTSHKQIFKEIKKLQLVFGSIGWKKIKTNIKKALCQQTFQKINFIYLKVFESRLDVSLYRAKFSKSIRQAKQFILHEKILVNHKLIKIKSYSLKKGDLITIKYASSILVKTKAKISEIWPTPPKHLIINYKTLHIVFGVFMSENLSLNYFYYLNVEKVLTSYYKN